jgi:hypothetical protein
MWPQYFNNCIYLVGQAPGDKMQPGEVWNADGGVKQEGAFTSGIKLAFRLLTSLWSVYIRSNKQQQGTFSKAVVNL